MVVLTTPEAAAYCRLSKQTLERYRVTGDGPKFLKFGDANGAVRYNRADLDAWLNSRLVISTSEVAA